MKPKLDIGLFVDLADFLRFYQFLHEIAHKIVQQVKTKQFYEQLHARSGKNFGAVSYLLSCRCKFLYLMGILRG